MFKTLSKMRKHSIFTYICFSNLMKPQCFWTIDQNMRKFTCMMENPGEPHGFFQDSPGILVHCCTLLAPGCL